MFTFTAKADDGTELEFEADSRDVLVMERTSKGKMTLAMFRDQMSMEMVYRLSWIAARRQGKTTDDLGEWEKAWAVDIADEDEDAEGGADPTPMGPGTGT